MHLLVLAAAATAFTATPRAAHAFADVMVQAEFEVAGRGNNVDSMAFWEAPDPTETLMFVTAKANHLVEVWKFPFTNNEQAPLTHSTFNAGQVNGVAIDQATGRLYIAVGAASSTVSVFSLPGLAYVDSYINAAYTLNDEPNLTLLNHPDGTRLYVSDGVWVHILRASDGVSLGDFKPATGLEVMAGDSFHQRVYIPDENGRTGVYVHHPDGTRFLRDGTNRFGSGDFDADAEGTTIYTCPSDGSGDDGSGFIVVSDQRSSASDFEVYDRVTWAHLGRFRIEGVANTDGIASSQRALPGYPLGVFVAQNDDVSVAGVGWDTIFAATGLSCGGPVPTTLPGTTVTTPDTTVPSITLPSTTLTTSTTVPTTTVPSVCGDGVRTGRERCDDGNLVDGDGCDSNCTPTGCGNGIVTASEACDEGPGRTDCCSPTSCVPVDRDLDGSCDREDSCPNVDGEAAVDLSGLKTVRLKYGSGGPGGNDDKPKVVKADFSASVPFDSETQDVHLRLANSGSTDTLFETTIVAGQWLHGKRGKVKKWRYKDPYANQGVRRAQLKLLKGTTSQYRLTLVGDRTNISPVAAPLVDTDGVQVTIELTTGSGGGCFQSTLVDCQSKRSVDHCDGGQ